MTTILPATQSIINQIADLSIKELTHIALAAIDHLDARGLHAAVQYHPLRIALYKPRARLFATAIYQHDTPPIFTTHDTQDEQLILRLTQQEQSA